MLFLSQFVDMLLAYPGYTRMFFLVLQYTTISTNLSKTTTKKKTIQQEFQSIKAKHQEALTLKKKKKKENKSPEF